MALGVGGNASIAHQADNDKSLAMFATALKVVSRRSAAVAQLLEAVTRALAIGETQLDSIRLDGLQATDEDVEVRQRNHSLGGECEEYVTLQQWCGEVGRSSEPWRHQSSTTL